MDSSETRTGRRTSAIVGWCAAWSFVAALVVVPHMLSYPQLSKLDELQHVDYLAKTQDLQHVNGGEKVGETAMREEACRGIELDWVLPPCRSKQLTPDQFPGGGFNHTYADPPTYYVVTGALAAVAEEIPGVDSLVTAGRSIGVLWLGAGLATTFLLGLRLGAGRLASAGATLLVASTPTVVEATATITTDAPELLVGGALCLVALGVADGRIRWWWLVLAAAAAMSVKVTSLPVVGVVVVFLLLQLLRRPEPEPAAAPPDGSPAVVQVRETAAPRRWPVLPTIGAVVLAALLPITAWAVFTNATTLGAVDDIPMGAEFRVDSIGWSQISYSIETTFSAVTKPYLPSLLDTDTVDFAVRVVNLLLILGVAAVSWFWSFATTAARMAIATLVGMLASGPGFVVLLFATMHVTYEINGRYALCLVPAAAACLALAASTRRVGEMGLFVLGLAGMAVLLAHTL